MSGTVSIDKRKWVSSFELNSSTGFYEAKFKWNPTELGVFIAFFCNRVGTLLHSIKSSDPLFCHSYERIGETSILCYFIQLTQKQFSRLSSKPSRLPQPQLLVAADRVDLGPVTGASGYETPRKKLCEKKKSHTRTTDRRSPTTVTGLFPHVKRPPHKTPPKPSCGTDCNTDVSFPSL